MSKINTRSPYYINFSEAGLESVSLELYVYTGTQGTRGAVKYTLTSTAISEKVSFEISELVRDYIEIDFDGSYSNGAVWVDYQTTRTVSSVVQSPDAFVQLSAFDGYGYFAEGSNPQNDSVIMQSNTLIQTDDYSNINIPIQVTEDTVVAYAKQGELLFQKTLLFSSLSSDQLQYVSNSALDSDVFYNRVIADGGTIESFQCVQSVANGIYESFDADRIYINKGGVVSVVDVKEVEECKYQTYKLTFVNKFGALQDLWFFKRSTLAMSTTQETYKSNIVTDGTYSINNHQRKILNKQGNETLTLNSGFYDEQYNEVFKQLFLSEQVWINYDTNTLPINITSNALTFKDKLNDKLISYEINVGFSNDVINNIR